MNKLRFFKRKNDQRQKPLYLNPSNIFVLQDKISKCAIHNYISLWETMNKIFHSITYL